MQVFLSFVVYYAFFYKNEEVEQPYTKLYAVPYVPGDGAVDLEKAVVLNLKYDRETPFAIGQLGNEIVNSSNMGGIYAFDGVRWKVLRASLEGVSFQLYSMLNWYDKLLMSQYPTGNLFIYDGGEVRHLKDWPPVMPGVSDRVREAQTTGFYGGDLYVGVWPWSELWRYDAHRDHWQFVKRMFRRPPITDEMNHPWEDRVVAYNEEYDGDIVINEWGQRVTGLSPMGDALYLSVSAKGCPERDMRLAFLHDDEVWDEYRVVHRLKKPGHVSVPVVWREGPTTLLFTVGEAEISIKQDRKLLGSAPIRREQVERVVKDAEVQWGYGMYGPLRAGLQSKAVER